GRPAGDRTQRHGHRARCRVAVDVAGRRRLRPRTGARTAHHGLRPARHPAARARRAHGHPRHLALSAAGFLHRRRAGRFPHAMNTPATPTALIAEDEPLLAQALKAELAAAWPELKIAAIAGDGRSAVREALR